MQDKHAGNYDNDRDFLGVWIPRNLWISDLSLQEKCLLVEIESLSKGSRGCFKSNKSLGRHMMLSPSRISSIISSLSDKGIISVNQIRDGKQCIERQIFMNCRLVDIATSAPYVAEGGSQDLKGGSQDPVRPPFENSEESNTLSNTKENNKSLGASGDKSPDDRSNDNTVDKHSDNRDCPHKAILDAWRQNMPEKKQPNQSLWAGTVRARNLAERWKEGFKILRDRGTKAGQVLYSNKDEGIVWWGQFFKFLRNSEFLMGEGAPNPKTGKPFDPDLDWILRKDNFTKILEYKYHEDPNAQQRQKPAFRNEV